MQVNFWFKKKVTVYVGGNPKKNEAPDITAELNNPQISIDQDKGIIEIKEVKGS